MLRTQHSRRHPRAISAGSDAVHLGHLDVHQGDIAAGFFLLWLRVPVLTSPNGGMPRDIQPFVCFVFNLRKSASSAVYRFTHSMHCGEIGRRRIKLARPPKTDSKQINNLTKITAAALAALTLSACATEEKMSRSEPTMRTASSAAESACMTAVNSNYGGKVRNLRVVSSEFSQANSEVIMDAVGVRGRSTTERWRCLSSNDGQVADLRVLE